jgi:peptidase C39-like protein
MDESEKRLNVKQPIPNTERSRMMVNPAPAALALAALAAGAAWFAWKAGQVPPQPDYTSQGYGGSALPRPLTPDPRSLPTDPVQPALDAYNAGRYREAEAGAEQVVRQAAVSKDPTVKKQGARARWVLAFSAARRKDLRLARQRFSVLRQEAAALRAGGVQAFRRSGVQESAEANVGAKDPSLEEEGAYQHAVLTAALGDNEAAEAEFKAFMRSYPESPLVHAAVRRIARFHGGNLPKDAEAVWQQATRTAQAREKEREVQRSLCGPEVLAEVLRRRSGVQAFRRSGEPASLNPQPPTLNQLAREMNTDERGTSLKALAEAARRHGFQARGLSLTFRGLVRRMHTPPAGEEGCLAALVQPGHFVLVEAVDGEQVRVWDPSGYGAGKPATRQYQRHEWERLWNGIALALW